MPLIIWDETFSVGVKEIDGQHQKMISIINRLFEMVANNNFNEAAVFNILNELVDYADYHFTTEERYFREFDYPKTESHIETHNDYRERIRELKEDYEDGKKNDVLADLAEFINGWWVWHINHSDKEYTQCFHDHGLY
ncbi:MAG TPA: bacteriohemerythrin [Candidatus Nanoarchaeia archaeon]|nr:bacteriohemerythrin [Candidatus Nanoarchaeia archaeon]